MSQAKKLSLYELNPRYFKDNSGNGTGDLAGLAAKFDYFKFIGVDGVILQDVLSTDSKDKIQNFQTIASEIGNLNDLVKVLSIAKKNGTQVLIELNIGSIKENHKWFENAIVEQTGEFENVIKVANRKEIELSEEDAIKYKYSSEQKSYYLVDSKTQEIPLNWKSEQVMEHFLRVIRFWRDLGISGFVFKNFEYLADIERKNLMSDATLKELRKFYRAIKNVEDSIIIVGKSDIIELKDAPLYTTGITQVLDYFMSTKVSMLGTEDEDSDFVGKFKVSKLVKDLKKLGTDASNIITFGSHRVGRIVSRWGNDNQYHQESAKAISMLLMLSNGSSSIYYGDEIGIKNIGLTHLDDFQDETLKKRMAEKVTNAYTELEFMNAQVLQNPINANALMAWNENKNGGFSTAEKTITPASTSYRLVNVETEFADTRSILNFNKQLIKITTDSTYAPIIAHGKYKISTFIPGVVKIVIRHNHKEVVALINFTSGNRPILSKLISGKVILSTYGFKEYKGIPNKLEAYEGIIVSKHTDEYLKEKEAEKEAQKRELERVAREKELAKIKAEEEKENIIREEQEAKAKAQREIEIAKQEAAEAEAKAKAQAEKEAQKARTQEIKMAELAAKEEAKAKTQEIKLAEAKAREEQRAKEDAIAAEAKAKAQAEKEAQKAKTQEIKLAEAKAKEEARAKTQEIKMAELAAKEEAKVQVSVQEAEIKEVIVEEKTEIAIESPFDVDEPVNVIEEQKAAQKAEQEALRAAAKNSGDTSRLTEDQVAKTTQVNIDTENIEDFIKKLNKKEK